MKYLKKYSLIIIILILILSNNSFSQQGNSIFYTTTKDESVFKIAEKFNIDYHLIMSENSLKEHFIKKGKEIKINGIKSIPYLEKVIYEVMPNDDIYKIAKRFNIDPNKIIYDNNIKNPYLLVIGKKLILENNIKPQSSINKISINPIKEKIIYYTSKKGDSLYTISEKYNKNFSEILYLNRNIKNLFTNQKVIIDKYYELNTNFNGIILNAPEKKLYIVKNRKFKSYNILNYQNNFDLYKEYRIEYKIENPDKYLDNNILNKINIQNKNNLSSKLGAYWIGLNWFGAGIHCTNGKNSEEFSYFAKTIKLDCNEAHDLFKNSVNGDKFIVIDEPYKIFLENNKVFLEVYKNINPNIIEKILDKNIKIDKEKIKRIILKKTGKKENINY